MKRPDPTVDSRRAKALYAELLARSQAWKPKWQPTGSVPDFGQALLRIAARIGSEVTERLDRTPGKMALGLLDWLGIVPRSGNPARMPAVFKMTDAATNPVLAPARVRIQANTGDTPVPFETTDDVLLIPSPVTHLVGVDPDIDAIYFPPADVLSLEPRTLGPIAWTVKSLASAGGFTLQLTPPLGLRKDMLLEVRNLEYCIGADPEGDLVTVDPAIGTTNPGPRLTTAGVGADVEAGSEVRKVETFAPFGGVSRNRQEHVLYLGDDDALNLTSPACIALKGGAGLQDLILQDLIWEYWGKRGDSQDPAWHALDPVGVDGDRLLLRFPGQDKAARDAKGSIETREILGRGSRWIRARRGPGAGSPISLQGLAVEINCSPVPKSCPAANGKDGNDGPKMEAVANTTSVVLNDSFHPFGKTPRQFDSFYLGCPEVFSKAGAMASIAFSIADSTLGPPVVTALGSGGYRIFAVAQDGALHQFLLPASGLQLINHKATRPPNRPNGPEFHGAEWRMPPALVIRDREVWVLVWSGNHAWIWKQQLEEPAPEGSWEYFDAIGDPGGSASVTQVVFIGAGAATAVGSTFVAVTSDGKLYTRKVLNDSAWHPLTDGMGDSWGRVAPVFDVTTGYTNVTRPDVFLGVSDGVLSRFIWNGMDGVWKRSTETFDQPKWAMDFTLKPILSRRGLLVAGKAAAAVATEPDKLAVATFDLGGTPLTAPVLGGKRSFDEVDTDGTVLGAELAWAIENPSLEAGSPGIAEFATLYLVATLRPRQSGAAARLAWWSPQDADPATSTRLAYEMAPGAAGGTLAGNPVIAGTRVIVPGSSQDVLLRNFSPLQRLRLPFDPRQAMDGIVTDRDFGPLDFLVSETGTIVTAGDKLAFSENRFLYRVKNKFSGDNKGTRYPVPDPKRHFNANTVADSADQLKLTDPPEQLGDKSVLMLYYNNGQRQTYGVYRVTKSEAGSDGSKTVTIAPSLPHHLPAQTKLQYYVFNSPPDFPDTESFTYEVKPTIACARNLIPDKQVVENRVLYFLDTQANPKSQTVHKVVDAGPDIVIVMDKAWEIRPRPFPSPVPGGLSLFAAVDRVDVPTEWSRYIGDVSSNPELSWEYWNGTGWWKIEKGFSDATANLKKSDVVQFEVPSDLRAADIVLGKRSHWIRARLIGGDYGREKFITTTEWKGEGGEQIQTVVVSTDDIRAPIVLNVSISYSICTPLTPRFLLTLDSGSWLDQSDANRTAQATVDAFVPIAERLARMRGDTSGTTVAAAAQPYCCGGQNPGGDPSRQATPPTGNPSASDAGSGASTDSTITRAIYLAYDKPLSGGPIRLLFLLEDCPHDAAAPLVVEALRSNRFEPVLATDETRVLGETGMVSFSLDASPSQAELFGKTGYWLRLRPVNADKAAGWSPAIKGVYANAVWAEAAESQMLEILGSSDGSPSQTFALLRPPVLRDSLELRVLEPLGDEEMKTLLTRPGTVKENVQGLAAGRWVLWREVTDPGDWGPDERVYGLDSVNGAIRFGDGEHGMIPPIGRESIVAFIYRHGGAAEGNRVPPFVPMDLVTPISGAEAVLMPDSAAGGADAEDAGTVQRFAAPRLRHRGRAVTLRDLEDLALDFSPDIVQAKAFDAAQGLRLKVVIGARGQTRSPKQSPDPTQAQIRELRTYLLEHASPVLARQGSLMVTKADPVSFRLELSLRVASVDVTGSVADKVSVAIERLFDPGVGGWDGLGWRIGDAPTEDDVAASLIAIEGLDSVEAVVFIRDGGRFPPANRLWIGPDQLAWLLPEGIKVNSRSEG